MLQKMLSHASACAAEIKRYKEILIVSHIDADGLTSAAIIGKTLENINIDFNTRFVKQLDPLTLKEIADLNPPLVIFTDLGSGINSVATPGINAIIADHHQTSIPKLTRHINPHLFGINGATELSGSGTCFILAQKLSPKSSLADLAVVGAVGDLQHLKHGQLIGINREILQHGIKQGILSSGKDLLMFGKQTRPIFKLLQYSSDPYLPGITGNEDASIEFLRKIGIRLHGERWRRWIDLEASEKKQIVSALIQFCLSSGIPPGKAQRLVGEVYILLREREGIEARDASEYSTLLNATARYDKADIGLAVCMGDRGRSYDKACDLLSEHRRNLMEGLNFVKERGLIQLENLQYFDAGSAIRETIVGIIAGMCSSFNSRELPIIALADSDGGIKVSARGTQDLVRRGLNLAAAMGETARMVGGAGGGHDIAAGAIIPRRAKEEFLTKLDSALGAQLGRSQANSKSQH